MPLSDLNNQNPTTRPARPERNYSHLWLESLTLRQDGPTEDGAVQKAVMAMRFRVYDKTANVVGDDTQHFKIRDLNAEMARVPKLDDAMSKLTRVFTLMNKEEFLVKRIAIEEAAETVDDAKVAQLNAVLATVQTNLGIV